MDELKVLLKQASQEGPEREAALATLAGQVRKKAAQEMLVALGPQAVGPLGLLIAHKDRNVRKACVTLLGELGPVAVEAAPQLSAAAADKEAPVRKAALAAIGTVGGEYEVYREPLSALLLKGDKAVVPILARWGEAVEPLVQEALESSNARVRKTAVELFIAIAQHLECAEHEDLVMDCLTHDSESWQKLGLEMVKKLRKPTLGLVESVADLSSFPGAKVALLRFPNSALKPELRSLIKSQSMEERVVGLDLVQHLGSSARELAPLIARVLVADTRAESARLAVHTLARLLPDEELGKALEPALDHFDANVQKAAKRYLAQADLPVRGSAWDGHPFSDALRIQLQRLGFKPKDIRTPDARPLPDRPFEFGEREASDEGATLSEAVWTLLNGLTFPPYQLYTVWGSYEDSQTFHFSSEDPIYVATTSTGRHLMHVIGDGSIGYFATIDLNDTSNDPAVYYIERWSGWEDSNWMVSRTLSGYLRQLGLRRNS